MTTSSDPQNFQNPYSSFSEPLKEKSLLEKTMKFVEETERIIQNMNKFPCPLDVHMTQESSHFENPASISSYQPELDQPQPLDSLASYQILEIELADECEPQF